MNQNELEHYLAAARPEASDEALGRVAHRLAPARRKHASSLLVSLCLALGIVSTGAGGALAVSGLAGGPTAVKAQYAAPSAAAGTSSTPTLGGGTTSKQNANGPSGDVASETANAPETAPSAAQAARQLGAAATSSGLPLTGYL